MAGRRLVASSPRFAAAVGLGVIVVVLLRDFLIAGQLFFYRDVHLVWIPLIEGVVRAAAAGAPPLWDPAPGFGQPLLADPQSQIFYPFAWLNLLLKPWTCYTVLVALHVWLSGVGMAALARRLGISAWVSVAVAALWIASGPFVSLFSNCPHMFGSAWIPWVLFAADRAFATRARTDVLLFGGAAGLQLLTGSPDMALMTAVLVAAHGLATHTTWARGEWGANARLAAVGAFAVLIAVGLSAGQWFATVAAAGESDRLALPEYVRTEWSIPALGLPETLYAGLWRRLPLAPRWRDVLFVREPFLASIYLGFGTWILAAFAVVGAATRRRGLVWIGLALGAVLMAMGPHAPLYPIAAELFLPVRLLRYPSKALVVAAFALALAAGYGLESLRTTGSGRTPRWALAGVGLVGLLPAVVAAWLWLGPPTAWSWLLDAATPDRAGALARGLVGPALRYAALVALALAATGGGRAARIAAALVGGLTIADLVVTHAHLNPGAPPSLFTHRPEVVDVIRRTELPRVYVYDYGATAAVAIPRPALALAPRGWSAPQAFALGQEMSLSPATAGRWGIETGYDLDVKGLYPHALAQIGLLLRHSAGTPLHDKLLRMGGITHVIALHEAGFEGLSPIAQFPGLFDRPIRLYAVPDALPRTYAVGAARVAQEAAGFARLAEEDFDPSREVVLEYPGPYEGPAGFVGTSRIEERRPDRVRLIAEMTRPGYVVLLDRFSSGWQVTIDGGAATPLRANLVFRAVAVPAGRHTIEWRYRPPAVLLGLAVSVMTIMLCAGVLGADRLKRRRSPAAAAPPSPPR